MFIVNLIGQSIYYEPVIQTKSPCLLILDSTIPYEIALCIFKHLNHADLASSTLVSKDWSFAACSPMLWQAFDLRKIFPSSIYLNEDWKSDFNFEVETKPLNKRYVISILKARCPFSTKKQKVFQTHTFLEVPKGMTLEYFANPEFFISHFHSDIFQKYGKNQISNTHCLLITNKILPTTLSKKFTEQKKIISNYPLYKIPSFITAIALNMARLMNTKHYYAFVVLHQSPSFAVFLDARWCQIEVNIGRIAPPIEFGLNTTHKGRGIIAAREFH